MAVDESLFESLLASGTALGVDNATLSFVGVTGGLSAEQATSKMALSPSTISN